jgi:hypothetical protein
MGLEVLKDCSQLQERFDKWISARSRFMPTVDLSTTPMADSDNPLDILCAIVPLPTSMKHADLDANGLSDLLGEELKLREAELEDLIVAIRAQVQLVSAATYRKEQEARGQDANTRANTRITSLKTWWDFLAAEYIRLRTTIVGHNLTYQEVFPPMTKAAMYRKRTDVSRQVGDSQKIDGFVHSRYRADMGAGPSIERKLAILDPLPDEANVEDNDSSDGKGPNVIITPV